MYVSIFIFIFLLFFLSKTFKSIRQYDDITVILLTKYFINIVYFSNFVNEY